MEMILTFLPFRIRIDPHEKKHETMAMTQDFTTHSKFKIMFEGATPLQTSSNK